MKRMFNDDCKFASLDTLLDIYVLLTWWCIALTIMGTIAWMAGVL